MTTTGAATPEVPKAPSSIASGKFSLTRLLGSGCFGEVWLGHDVRRDQTVAVKLEIKGDSKQLLNEYEILQTLKVPSQMQGFTEIFHFGREGAHVCLVMELLGKSLEDLLEVCGGKFTVASAALVGEQIVRRLEYLHSKSIIHRDIKPENFMMGVGARSHIIYLIDFGLSEVYYNQQEAEHASRQKDSLTGTARYASISAHNWSQSRRDDLEAVGHMLIYFVRGNLPWSGLDAPAEEDDTFSHIRDAKKATSLDKLCEGIPQEFKEYLRYCRALGFTGRPDYARLRLLFSDVLKRNGNVKESDLQWLREEKGFRPENLEPIEEWPVIAQPDDGAPMTAFSLCGCCKRREPQVERERQPLAESMDTGQNAETLGRISQFTE
mmetsp:Transcript_94323/g.149146  ORF Transcript_94323/g.149146 Transcript_94323/m.149146 type:complete len:380 (-) Transcript_94323:141-1280(-)